MYLYSAVHFTKNASRAYYTVRRTRDFDTCRWNMALQYEIDTDVRMLLEQGVSYERPLVQKLP